MTLSRPGGQRRVFSLPIAGGAFGRSIEVHGDNWQIAGIVVDNPSGSWLLVDPLGLFVAPYTQGWAQPISPTTMRLTISFVEVGPAGTPSSLIGNDAVIAVTSLPVEMADGTTSLPGGSSGYGRNFVEINVPEIATAQIMVPGIAGQKIIPVAVQFLASSTPPYIKGLVGCDWRFGATLFAEQVITPENPMAPEPSVEWIADVIGAGDNINVSLRSATGAATNRVIPAIVFYMVTA